MGRQRTQGNSCVISWTKTKPGILKLTIRRGQSNFSIAFISVSREKNILSCRFDRTANVLTAASTAGTAVVCGPSGWFYFYVDVVWCDFTGFFLNARNKEN